MWRRWLIIIVTLCVVGVAQLWWRQIQDEESAGDADSSELQYRMQDFTMRIIAADGSEQLRITAPLLIDQGEGLPSELTRPVVTSMDAAQRWQISADRALLNRQTDEAEFMDNVVVNNLDQQGSARLETSYLRFQLENKSIHSPELVTITRPGLLLRGIGLQGNIDTARYHLQSNVQATYVDQ
jgi:lipopolysaccharide export system protein LptC